MRTQSARHRGSKGTNGSPRPGNLNRVIAHGAVWSTGAQFTPVLISIVLTPYIISSLGLTRYGFFLLANTVVAFLGTFDGGVGASVARFSAVYSGRDNRPEATRLVCTMMLLISSVTAAMLAVLFVSATALVSLFSTPTAIRGEGIFLLKTLSIVLAIGQFRGLFAAQLTARQRYAYQSSVAIAAYIVYAIGILITVHFGMGLRGVAITLLGQAFFEFVLTVPPSMRYLDRTSIGLMSKADLRHFLRYALSAQGVALTGIVNTQLDVVIVARLLSVAAVSIYGIGSSFASQIRAVPLNILGPMFVALAQAYGRGGDEEVLTLFAELQRRWVQISTAFCSVALGASYFGIVAWLGDDFKRSGVICAVLSGAYALHLWTGTLTGLLSAAGQNAVEVRYAAFTVGINVVLTVPLVTWLGVLGTVVATSLGLVFGSFYYIRIARRTYRSEIPSFLRDVPVIPAVLTITFVGATEFIVMGKMPSGAPGLIFCGLVAVPGFAVFAAALLGPTRAWRLAASRMRL